ncbi:MAG: hypothetical protein WCX93_04990 [Burkholderiaceae bacterium]
MTNNDTDALGLTFLIDRNYSHNQFFQGYCFHGRDMIFGAEGAAAFLDATGLSIPPGEDGTYASMIRQGRRYLFYSDFNGFKKIFYYWIDGEWAVSNSIPRIIEHMQSRNVDVKLNPHRLTCVTARGAIFNQLTSFNTFVEGVYLLPLNYILDISDDRALAYPHIVPIRRGAYGDLLSDAVELWVSRMETVLSDQRVIARSDLTGGMDSRTVLSLLLKAQERLGIGKKAELTFRCGVSERSMDDVRVATGLSKKYGFPLNVNVGDNYVRLSPTQSYASWKHSCLGSYFPIYFPNMGPSAYDISFGGGGGESHRPWYAKHVGTNDEVVALPLLLKALPEGKDKDALQREIEENYTQLATNCLEENPSALTQHYRTFRNRFHTGRSPQYLTSYTPLASRYFEGVVRAATSEMTESAQLQYDIMESLVGGLMYEDYDKESKKATPDIISRLTYIKIKNEARPGSLYAPTPPEFARVERGDRTTFDMLNDEFERAVQKPNVSDIWGEQNIKSCRQILSEAIVNGKFGHAIDGRVVSAIIATGLV